MPICSLSPSHITTLEMASSYVPVSLSPACLPQRAATCRRRSEELQLPHLVAFSRLALARFELLHPQPPPAASEASSSSSSSGSGGADPPCASSVAVAGAARDVAHLHMATRLAAATPAAPPASSGTSTARVLRGVTDLFTAMPPMFAPRMQGKLGCLTRHLMLLCCCTAYSRVAGVQTAAAES